MSVPARVAAEAAAADVQLAELAQAAANGTLDPAGPPQPTNPTPPPAPPAPPAPAPAPTTPVAQPVDNTLLLQQLSQRLGTMEGRLQAESTARQTAERELAELRRTPPAPPTPPTPPPTPVTDAERSDFGTETVDFITKIATHVATQVGNSLGQRLAAVEGRLNATTQQVQQVARVEQQTLAERYFATVSSAVPDWEAINVSDDFMQWLQNVDKASNKPYMELLTAAHEQGHASPVIHIFSLYKQEKGLGPAPAPQPPPPSQPSGHIDPASLAAPSTTAPTPPPSGNAPQGKIWTMAEVNKLYDDFQKKYISRQTFEVQEAAYMQALAEGRVAAS